MINNLVLFCGGDEVHTGNKPKPLVQMPNSLTILENYLRSEWVRSIPWISIITEFKYSKEIQVVLEQISILSNKIDLLECSNGSSTLEKIKRFATLKSATDENCLLTYPDIFYFGNWQKILQTKIENGRMFITGVPLQSRFPEISFDPYTRRVRSVSLRPKRMPANFSTIYGGQLLASISNLKQELNLFEKNREMTANLTLEGDFFSYLVSKRILQTIILNDQWIKADSYKEMLSILQLLDQ